MGVLKEVLRALFSSKKFVAALVAMLVWIAGKVGLHLSTEVVSGAIAPLLTYIVGQGIADQGKPAAIVAQQK